MIDLASRPWVIRALTGVLILVILTPLFGWAAGAVGYTEPLENAAEKTGADENVSPVVSGLLYDYAVPGLSSPAGTFVSAIIGTSLTLVVVLSLARVLEQ